MRARSLGILGLGLAVVVACTKVPYTDRAQYNLVPDDVMTSLGKSTYADMLASEKLVKTGDDAKILTSVGGKISKVAKHPDFAWDETLIDSDEINAWCLPGGYIGFYTGILPVLKNEAGMAFVMGHEVGHATARHGSERMSQQLTMLGGLAGLYLILDSKTKLDSKTNATIVGALGVGATLGIIRPFSRMHESEADVIGTMYMASAGYPPDEAIKLWDRMSAQTGGSSTPAFLSTHPSDDKRQAHIKEWLPQARKRYERNKLPYDALEKRW